MDATMPMKFSERTIIGACAAVAVVLAAVIIFNCVSHLMESNGKALLGAGEWASWVQAIGSIGAIIAAAFIATWQAKKTTELQLAIRRDDRLVVMLAVLTLAREYDSLLAKTAASLLQASATSRPPDDMRPRELFSHVEEALRAIPLHQLPNPAAVPAMSALRSSVAWSRRAIFSMWDELATGARDKVENKMAMEGLRDDVNPTINELDRIVRALGGDPAMTRPTRRDWNIEFY